MQSNKKRKFTQADGDGQNEAKLVYMYDKQTVHLSGYALMKVVFGSVKIHGYVTSKHHEPFPLFALEQYGTLSMTTGHVVSPNIASRDFLVKMFKKNDYLQRFVDEIPKNVGSYVAIVYFEPLLVSAEENQVLHKKPRLEQVVGSPVLRFVNRCYEVDLQNQKVDKVDPSVQREKIVSSLDQLTFPKLFSEPLVPLIEYEDSVLSTVAEQCQLAQKNSIIVVTGVQKVGKSTLTRMVANKLLSRFDSVAYLDLDPTNPEFTLRGCLSLTILKKPLLGPSFTNIISGTQPELTLFFGHGTIESDIDHYMKCSVALFTHYATQFRKSAQTAMPLVVHTANSLHIPGFEALLSLIRIIQPNFILKVQDGLSRYKYDSANDVLDINSLYPSNPCHMSFNVSGPYAEMSKKQFNSYATITAVTASKKVMERPRDSTSSLQQHFIMAQYLAAFGRTLSKTQINNYLRSSDFSHSYVQKLFSELPYYKVSWNKFCIALSNDLERETTKDQDRIFSHSLYLLNGALVGLASANLTQLSTNEGENLPSFIVKPPVTHKCFGLGFIRSICPREKKFHIITSIEASDLPQVNLMLAGSVTISYLFVREGVEHSVAKPYFVSSSAELQDKNLTDKMNKQESVLRNKQANQTRLQKVR